MLNFQLSQVVYYTLTELWVKNDKIKSCLRSSQRNACNERPENDISTHHKPWISARPGCNFESYLPTEISSNSASMHGQLHGHVRCPKLARKNSQLMQFKNV